MSDPLQTQAPTPEAPYKTQIAKEFREGLPDGSINDLAKGYHALTTERDQLKSQSGIRVPGEDAGDDEVKAYREAIGVPESPDGYEITAPDDLPEGIQFSDDELKSFKAMAHKLNIPVQVAAELVKYDTERRRAAYDAFEAQNKELDDKALNHFRGKYRATWEKQIEKAYTLIEKTAGKEAREQIERQPGRNVQIIDAFVTLSNTVSEDALDAAVRGGGGEADGPNYNRLYPKMMQRMRGQ